MANKRVFKVATASAVAASALVAAVPASAASVTYEQAEKQVNVAREAANGLHAEYTRNADYKTVVDSKEARDELARAKAKIAALSNAKQKAYLNTRIQGTIDTVERANKYNNAVRVAVTYLPEAHKALETALENVKEDVATAEMAKEKFDTYVKQAEINFGKVYGAAIQAKFKEMYLTDAVYKAQKDATDKIAEAKAVVKVESVSAISSKKIEVKFSKAVDDTKAQFAVKKGTSTIGVASTSWSTDKKSVTLELNSKISEGTYEVSVTGLTDTALTGSVVAANEKVQQIKVLSDKLVLATDDANTATVGYQILNQYGEDITSTTLANSSNLVVTTSANSVSLDNKGTATITKTGDGFKTGDVVSLTMVDKATTKSATATLTVAAEAKVAETTVTGIFNKDNKSLNEDTLSSDFYLLFNAMDQYGRSVTGTTALENDLTFVVSNPAVVDIDEDDISNAVEVGTEKKLGILLQPKAKGEATITIISNSTGKSSSYKVTVGEGTKVDTVTLSSPDGIVAGGEEILVPITVTDNKGTTITDVKKLSGVNFNATQGGAEVDVEAVAKEGKLYAKLTTETVAANSVGTLVLTASTPTNKIATKVVEVKPDAKPVAITGVKSTVSKSLYDGTTKGLDWANFTFEDQYGRAYTAAENTGKYIVVATDATPAGGSLSVAPLNNSTNDVTGTDPNFVNGIQITGEEKGTELVTFALRDVVANSEVSSIDLRFTTVVQSEFASYKVKAGGPMFYTTDADYATDLAVYGVTASGQEVKLPEGEFNVYTGTGLAYNAGKLTSVADIDGDTDGDQPLVDLSSVTTAIPATKDVTVRVVIENTGDELSVVVPVNAEAPKVTTFEVRTPVDGSLKDGTVANALDLAATDGAFGLADLDQNIYVVDQYGVEAESVSTSTITFADGSTTATSRLTVSNLVNENKNATVPTIANNGSSSTALTGLEVGDTFTAKITTGTSTATVNVTVTSTP